MSMVPAQLFFRMKFKENPRKTRIYYLPTFGQDEFILITNFLSTCLVSKWFFYYRYIYLEPVDDPCFDWSLGFFLEVWPSKIEVMWVPGGSVFPRFSQPSKHRGLGNDERQDLCGEAKYRWRHLARPNGKVGMMGKGHPSNGVGNLHSIWDWKLWLFDVLFSRL